MTGQPLNNINKILNATMVNATMINKMTKVVVIMIAIIVTRSSRC